MLSLQQVVNDKCGEIRLGILLNKLLHQRLHLLASLIIVEDLGFLKQFLSRLLDKEPSILDGVQKVVLLVRFINAQKLFLGVIRSHLLTIIHFIYINN